MIKTKYYNFESAVLLTLNKLKVEFGKEMLLETI